jgi:DNA mismatch endonuclease, patch repair protein
MDVFRKRERSRIMGSVRSRDTAPELLVRRICYALGHRYRLCVRGIPGSPDLVFSRSKKLIFVNGCFWHRHSCTRGALPKTRFDFWRNKLEGNRRRDRRIHRRLKAEGWKVLVVWQCQTRDLTRLSERLRTFLGPANPRRGA